MCPRGRPWPPLTSDFTSDTYEAAAYYLPQKRAPFFAFSSAKYVLIRY